MSGLAAGAVLAVVIARDGALPAGAAAAHTEAGGRTLVAGTGAAAAAATLPGAGRVWWWETPATLGPAALARALGPVLTPVRVVILPASPDGRDLAPRLAAALDRPLLAGALSLTVNGEPPEVRGHLLRVDGRVLVPVAASVPVVATLAVLGRDGPVVDGARPVVEELRPAPVVVAGATVDAEVLGVVEPEPETMDLRDATRVLGGGAGLVRGDESDAVARRRFDLLVAVAARIGASAGATRVVTDAGWAPHERQIGTTGVAVDPDLYVAFGVSGAAQHTGGLGHPSHVVSINTDPSCPMTARADLGVVADAPAVLAELARRLDVDERAGAAPEPGR